MAHCPSIQRIPAAEPSAVYLQLQGVGQRLAPGSRCGRDVMQGCHSAALGVVARLFPLCQARKAALSNIFHLCNMHLQAPAARALPSRL